MYPMKTRLLNEIELVSKLIVIQFKSVELRNIFYIDCVWKPSCKQASVYEESLKEQERIECVNADAGENDLCA